MASEERAISLDALGMETMASGHLCLNLSERVTWEAFPSYAEALLKVLNGTFSVVAESVEMRIWEVSFGADKLSLVWNDYPAMVSLESLDDGGDAVLRKVHSILQIQAGCPPG